MEIFSGTDDIIDQWLGLAAIGQPPQYQHRASFYQMLCGPLDPASNGRDLVAALLARMNANWQLAQGAGNAGQPSDENWRFTKHIEIAQANASRETRLERLITLLTDEDWANQIPVASGLIGDGCRRCCIDLARRKRDTGEYWLFELKWGSDSPLSAAIQMVRYGVLYLFWRIHRCELMRDLDSQPVLGAEAIHLRVLAPRTFYATDRPGSLLWLETMLSDGIAAVARQQHQTIQQTLTMDFRFDVFNESFYEAFYR